MDMYGPAASALAGATPIDRKKAILAAAAQAFSASGFKGASLREIASDAGVSLTLLSHHFGSKASLLAAVVANHHLVCHERMVELRALIVGPHAGSGVAVPIARLVAEWVRFEFDLYASVDGEHYLLLMLKLADESELDVNVQRTLDCSEPVILQGFLVAAPEATDECRVRAFRAARAALHVGIKDFSAAVDEGHDDAMQEAVDFTIRFLVSGLDATLH